MSPLVTGSLIKDFEHAWLGTRVELCAVMANSGLWELGADEMMLVNGAGEATATRPAQTMSPRPGETILRSRMRPGGSLQDLRCWNASDDANYQHCVPDFWARRGQYGNPTIAPRDWFANQK